ncbi:uncharacterized protein [Haliotis cracherodii]|uniref:uncharacterized protein n=1 Tax=Haliotis cracherodii TaxID=6455 RepID=UPI0039E77DBA
MMGDTLLARTVLSFLELSSLQGKRLIHIVTGLEVSVLVVVGAVAVWMYVRRRKRIKELLHNDNGPTQCPGPRDSCGDVLYDEIEDRKPPLQQTNSCTVSNVYSTMTRDSTEEVSYTEMNTTNTDGASSVLPNVISGTTQEVVNAENIGYINVTSSEPTTTVDLITENIYSNAREELEDKVPQKFGRTAQPWACGRAQSQYINDAFEDEDF